VSAPFRCDQGTIYRTNRKALVVALAVVALGPAIAAGSIARGHPHPYAPIGVTLFVLGLAAASAFGRYFSWPSWRTGSVQADGEGIHLDGELVLRRERAARGLSRAVPGQAPRVRFVGHRDQILMEVEVPSEEEAKQLLRATELDTRGQVARFTLSHPWLSKPAAFIALSWAPMVLGATVGFGTAALVERLGGSDETGTLVATVALVALAVACWQLYRRSRTRLVVGPDGVHVGSFGRQRYVPYDQIEAVEPWPSVGEHRGTPMASEGLDLVLRSGERIGMRTIAQRVRHGDPAGDFILDEIRTALVSYRRRDGTRLNPLDRAGRTAAQWLQDLRALGAGAQAGHRSAAAPTDEMWRVLEDPNASADQRAASAVALAAGGDAGARLRIERLSGATANPQLQAALEAAAEDELEELERALETLDLPGGPTRNG